MGCAVLSTGWVVPFIGSVATVAVAARGLLDVHGVSPSQLSQSQSTYTLSRRTLCQTIGVGQSSSRSFLWHCKLLGFLFVAL
jgi:hypothetical protein